MQSQVLKIFILMCAALMISNLARAETATLAWDPNTESDLAGYKVYFGTSSSAYNQILDVGLTATPATPQYTINNLSPGITYYFVVTAYNTSGSESTYSNEVSKTFANPSSGGNEIPVAIAGPDQIVETESLVTLDGTQSYDGDSNFLSYTWTQRGGTNIQLQGEDTANPQFYPVDSKTYAFELLVNDGTNQGTTDEVRIYVMDKILIKEIISASAGGSLSIDGGDLAGLQLVIPPGALPADTLIGIGQDFSLPLVKRRRIIQIPASFEPSGISFSQPVTVIIPYDPQYYRNPAKLKIYLYDESTLLWEEVPIIRIDQARGLITVKVSHFSSLAVTEDEEAANSDGGGNGFGFGCGRIKNVSGRLGPGSGLISLNLLLYALLPILIKIRRSLRLNRTLSSLW